MSHLVSDGVYTIKSPVINGSAVASTLIGTTDSLMRFLVRQNQAMTVTVTGSTATSPVISIGTNSPTYDNIVAAFTLSALTAASKILNLGVSSLITTIAPGTQIFVRVSTASSAATYNFRVSLFGFYY